MIQTQNVDFNLVFLGSSQTASSSLAPNIKDLATILRDLWIKEVFRFVSCQKKKMNLLNIRVL